MVGIKRAVGEIRAQHQQRVAALDRVVARRETDQAGHADIIGIFVFQMFLAAEGVDDRRFQLSRQFDYLGM